MDYFPVFMDLRGQEVLVVGGGAVGERKIRLLIKAGAKVKVVAEHLSENVAAWRSAGQIRFLSSQYESSQLQGSRLVFAATDDRALNRRVYSDSETRGIPVNVVDDSEYCRFISPAVVDRSPVQIAISTGGASPVLARLLRTKIERLLPRGLGRVASALHELRREVKSRLPLEARRRFWESLIDWRRLQQWSTGSGAAVRGQVRLALEQDAKQLRQGVVYLVGAGPGNPDLLTLRAQDVLSSADVILHDRLVSDEILDLARRDADRIYVGKEAGNHHRRQDEIHRIMLAEAARGRSVVRLKGGDAFVFGRGGEELEVLQKAGVPYEVVPGITAAMGCAAYAGIPLTHRDHAQTLTFLTGHLSPDKAAAGQNTEWSNVAGEGRTAVVYMGIGQAAAIRRGILEAGISPDLPVALIEDGSRDSQRVLHGTVKEIPKLAAGSRKGHPGLLVIGQVAALGGTLGWFQSHHTIKNAA